jgi:hypothetical protein
MQAEHLPEFDYRVLGELPLPGRKVCLVVMSWPQLPLS